eukprot:gene1934-16443_t
MAKEIDERVTPAWKRFGQYSTFLRDQRMPMCLKRKIMNTVILPSMTYGAETWSLTNRQREKLAVTQRSMERSMLGVTRRDKIRNEDLRSRTGINNIKLMIACLNQDANEMAKNIEKQQRELRKMKGHLLSTESRLTGLENSLKKLKIEFQTEEQMLSDLGDTSKNEELLSMAEVDELQEPQPGPSSATE